MKKHMPWQWIPSLFIAEEIPSVFVTFIMLLVFYQMSSDMGIASLLSGILMLPWITKTILRSKIRNAGNFRYNILCVELALALTLISIAVQLHSRMGGYLVTFVLALLLCVFCAWHELLARMYYNRMLTTREQAWNDPLKTISSQTSIVMTYGMLIFFVGVLQVFMRSITYAWSMCAYMMAGALLLLWTINYFLLGNPRLHNPYRHESMLHAFLGELHIADRIRHVHGSVRALIAFFFLILPQSLMFNTRVFFLLASEENGGLNCTLQEIGFAQGTIGVIAFSLGIFLGKQMLRIFGYRKSIFNLLNIIFTLSPVFYMLMAHYPVYDNIFVLCLLTTLAQFCFGFGLNTSMFFLRLISGERYRTTINYLYIPLIASCMFLPVCLSGYLCQELGFRHFFTLNAACIPLALIIVELSRCKKVLKFTD